MISRETETAHHQRKIVQRLNFWKYARQGKQLLFTMVIVVMGVAGSGKTLIGRMLAESLQWIFADGDQFHPALNVEKMTRGLPLTDADRKPWLAAIRCAIDDWSESRQNAVLACSALKQKYRDELTSGVEARIVYLKGSAQLIHDRLSHRQNHFMKPEMLSSQLTDLEEPEDAIVIDVSQAPDEIIAEIRRRLCIPP